MGKVKEKASAAADKKLTKNKQQKPNPLVVIFGVIFWCFFFLTAVPEWSRVRDGSAAREHLSGRESVFLAGRNRSKGEKRCKQNHSETEGGVVEAQD